MKGVKLTYSIISIITGSLVAVYGFIIFLLVLQGGIWGLPSSMVAFFAALAFIEMLFGVTLVVLGAMSCRDMPQRGMAIALLVLSSIMIVLFVVALATAAFFSVMNILLILAYIAIVTLATIYLINFKQYWDMRAAMSAPQYNPETGEMLPPVMPQQKPMYAQQPYGYLQPPRPAYPYPQHHGAPMGGFPVGRPTGYSTDECQKKLDLYAKLKKDGVISEDEYKTRVARELDKLA